MKRLLIPCLLIAFSTVSCMQPSMAAERTSLSLASFTANDVRVSIQLEGDQNTIPILSATFTPPDGYHLYGNAIPLKGLNGLGRPTLLELTADSQIKAVSELMESVEPQVPNFEPKELLVYPSGDVTLSMEVELPAGDEWVDDSVSVTYMACSDQLCKPPVVGKIVAVRIPAANVFNTP